MIRSAACVSIGRWCLCRRVTGGGERCARAAARDNAARVCRSAREAHLSQVHISSLSGYIAKLLLSFWDGSVITRFVAERRSYEGCASVDLGSPQKSDQFFVANRKTCDDWFARARAPLLGILCETLSTYHGPLLTIFSTTTTMTTTNAKVRRLRSGRTTTRRDTRISGWPTSSRPTAARRPPSAPASGTVFVVLFALRC